MLLQLSAKCSSQCVTANVQRSHANVRIFGFSIGNGGRGFLGVTIEFDLGPLKVNKYRRRGLASVRFNIALNASRHMIGLPFKIGRQQGRGAFLVNCPLTTRGFWCEN